ncbi:MAG TPA: dihydrofolate reductase [Ramlibacter sp.]|nr:dihydrofolate reductase [Ramlibacter sp.]
MKVGLVYARAANGVIGKEGVLPWHLPEDLAHFKHVTMGAPVLMGRKTWESLPPRFRPLPGRRNVVITRNENWSAEGAHRASSLDAALALCADQPTVWVIGGAQVFAEAMEVADVAEVTEIDRDFDGDVILPPLGAAWTEAKRERHRSSAGFDYSFVTYTKA